MTRPIPALALLAAALSLSACESRVRPVADRGGGLDACAGCHGDPARDADPLVRAAPPASTVAGDGGAHLAHLGGSPLRAPLACAECHVVPTLVDHSDRAVDVAMADLAAAGGASPSFDPGTATCSGVYCHGATLGGGPAETPAWSSTADLGCASCHGLPPPAPHPAGAACGDCHPGYTSSTVDPATHVDGILQGGGHEAGYGDPARHGYDVNAGGLESCRSCHGADLAGGTSGPSCDDCHGGAAWRTSCTFCHGNPSTLVASPPVDTRGRSSTANVSVGVHASHVATAIATPVACTQCHPDRAGSNVTTDAAHVDGDGVAEVGFAAGTLARTGGAAAAYTRASATSATCASTYCHGQFTGGTGADPGWTSATQAGCNACHGEPPGTGDHGTHSSVSCHHCHNTVVDSTRAVVGRALHVNGRDDVAFGGVRNGNPVTGTWNGSTRQCSSLSCHGGETW